MLTRTIKNTKVNFLNINIEKRTFEPTEITVEYGMSERQIEKYLKEQGYTPADIKTENIPSARYGMTEYDFYTFGEIIEKKSDIKGRSITKEMTVQTAQAVVAMKVLGQDWEIKNITVFMFDGNFDSRMYNTKNVRLLEVGEFSEANTYMIGMKEDNFIQLAHEIK